MAGLSSPILLLLLFSALLPEVSRYLLPTSAQIIFIRGWQLIYAGYSLRVTAYEYENSEHRRSNGRCCDKRCGDCDNYFRFCLISGRAVLVCYNLPVIFPDGDSLTFGTPYFVRPYLNPVVIRGFVWPVSYFTVH